MTEIDEEAERAIFRDRLLAAVPFPQNPHDVAASVLEPSRFTIETSAKPLTASISCPDATEDEVRQIAERTPAGWLVTINGRSPWEILQ